MMFEIRKCCETERRRLNHFYCQYTTPKEHCWPQILIVITNVFVHAFTGQVDDGIGLDSCLHSIIACYQVCIHQGWIQVLRKEGCGNGGVVFI